MTNLTYEAPLGTIEILHNGWEITRISLNVQNDKMVAKHERTPFEEEIIHQFDAYFRGERRAFDLPCRLEGTPFQCKVWETLKMIPYGETWSYKQLAEAVGNPKASQAVGQANRRNPFPIIIPCHRVIGKNNKLIGYLGDQIQLQAWLLQHEKNIDNIKIVEKVCLI